MRALVGLGFGLLLGIPTGIFLFFHLLADAYATKHGLEHREARNHLWGWMASLVPDRDDREEEEALV